MLVYLVVTHLREGLTKVSIIWFDDTVLDRLLNSKQEAIINLLGLLEGLEEFSLGEQKYFLALCEADVMINAGECRC